jgi:uncharacterized alpha-E superfamily protein
MGWSGANLVRRSAFCQSYWLGRHIERAASVGRLATVHCRSHADSPLAFAIIASAATRAFGEVAPSSSTYEVHPSSLYKELLFGNERSSSVRNCLRYALHNATRVRDLLSDSQWTALFDMREALSLLEQGETYGETEAGTMETLEESAALILAEARMSLDGGSIGSALIMGSCLERALQVLLVVSGWQETLREFPQVFAEAQWFALSACGGELAYRQVVSSDDTCTQDPFEFLVFSTRFERSVLKSLETARYSWKTLAACGQESQGVVEELWMQLEGLDEWLSRKSSANGTKIIDVVQSLASRADELFCVT